VPSIGATPNPTPQRMKQMKGNHRCRGATRSSFLTHPVTSTLAENRDGMESGALPCSSYSGNYLRQNSNIIFNSTIANPHTIPPPLLLFTSPLHQRLWATDSLWRGGALPNATPQVPLRIGSSGVPRSVWSPQYPEGVDEFVTNSDATST